MQRIFNLFTAMALACLAAALPALAQAPAGVLPSYRLVLPEPQVFRINNLGQAIGNRVTGTGVTHGFIASGGTVTDLGSLGGYSYAGAINDRGEVAGVSLGVDGRVHLFLYTQGSMRDLGVLGADASVSGLNMRGEITGNHRPPGRDNVAFLYSNGKLRELPPVSKTYPAYARAINDHGQVVGIAESEDAIVWQGGRSQLIGPWIAHYSLPEDINERGDIVGMAGLPGSAGPSDGKAFLYADGKVTDLGTLGGPFAYAIAINNHRQIVGGANIAFLQTRAFYYDAGRMVDLNTLVQPGSDWTLDAGIAINDRGQILAQAYRGNEGRIVRLDPIRNAGH